MNKPICNLIKTDGNVFALAAQVGKALRKAGQQEQAKEFFQKLGSCYDYDEALRLMMQYVDIE